MAFSYNENAYALSWEVLNGQEDIGKWMLYGGEEIQSGIGFESFFSAAIKLSDKINIVYMKDLRWFLVIAGKFIDMKDKEYKASKNRMFFIQIADNLELREIKNFWEEGCDEVTFLKRLEVCRDAFRTRQQKFSKEFLVNKVSLKTHYRYTLASEMWSQMQSLYFLQCNGGAKVLVHSLLPQDEEELLLITEKLNKASFCWANPDYLGQSVPRVYSYDLSSSHLSFFARKKFPYEPFQEVADVKEISSILHSNYYAWCGTFYFEGLAWKTPFKFNMQSGFTYWAIRDTENPKNWQISLTNVDYEWFCKTFTWKKCSVFRFYKSRQKELPRDLAVMFEDLYAHKSAQKKGTFAKDIFKFRAELPYGQPMKALEQNSKLVYLEEEENFEPICLPSELTFEDKIKKLTKRGLPYVVSLWVVAYSRAEWHHVASKIGWDNMIYGDTDSVYFVGEEGHKVVEERNKEITEEFKLINSKRCLNFDEHLGKWEREEDCAVFKSIGKKWYIKEDFNGNIKLTCAGVDKNLLLEKLNATGAPFINFSFKGMRDFQIFPYIKRVGVHGVEKGYNFLTSDEKKRIKIEETPLYGDEME